MITGDDLRAFAATLAATAASASSPQVLTDIASRLVAAADRIDALERERIEIIERCAQIADETVLSEDSPIRWKAIGVVHAGACLQVARRIRDLGRAKMLTRQAEADGSAPSPPATPKAADIGVSNVDY